MLNTRVKVSATPTIYVSILGSSFFCLFPASIEVFWKVEKMRFTVSCFNALYEK